MAPGADQKATRVAAIKIGDPGGPEIVPSILQGNKRISSLTRDWDPPGESWIREQAVQHRDAPGDHSEFYLR